MDVTPSCPICDFTSPDPVVLECNHTFCVPCIDYWARQSPSCPLCRAVITKSFFRILNRTQLIRSGINLKEFNEERYLFNCHWKRIRGYLLEKWDRLSSINVGRLREEDILDTIINLFNDYAYQRTFVNSYASTGKASVRPLKERYDHRLRVTVISAIVQAEMVYEEKYGCDGSCSIDNFARVVETWRKEYRHIMNQLELNKEDNYGSLLKYENIWIQRVVGEYLYPLYSERTRNGKVVFGGSVGKAVESWRNDYEALAREGTPTGGDCRGDVLFWKKKYENRLRQRLKSFQGTRNSCFNFYISMLWTEKYKNVIAWEKHPERQPLKDLRYFSRDAVYWRKKYEDLERGV